MLFKFFTNQPTQYDDEYVVVNKRAKVAKVLFLVIFVILLYIFVWYPNYGGNLRFKIGSITNWLINFLGTFLMSLGGILMVYGILMIFLRKGSSGVKTAIIGAVMCYVGFTILGGVFMANNEYEGVTQGYH